MSEIELSAEMTLEEMLELSNLQVEQLALLEMLENAGAPLPRIAQEDREHAAGRAYDAANAYNAANAGCRWWQILGTADRAQAESRANLDKRVKWDAATAKRARDLAGQIMPISDLVKDDTAYASLDARGYPVVTVHNEPGSVHMDDAGNVRTVAGGYDVIVHRPGQAVSCMTTKERLELGYRLARAEADGIIAL